MISRIRVLCSVVLTALWLVGCGGGGSGDPGGGIGGTGVSTFGTLRLSLTDAPACGYDAVNVTIEKIRVHQSDAAGEGDGGWQEVVLNPAVRVDLLTLRNGVLLPLGQTALPAGKYTQMRLVLGANSSAQPLANSVTPTGAAETALTTPSAQQSGLKTNVDIDVPAGKVVDFVIDFDACKSIVKRGNSGQYNLKPVLTVFPLLPDAGLRVEGFVAPAIANGGTQISVQRNGTPVKATAPEANGYFLLYPVLAGNYDLVVSAAGHVTAVITDVPVVAASPTVINTVAQPIAPGLATLRPVVGTVMPPDATLHALQTLTGESTVEVAWSSADALLGSFALQLPIEAPLRTGFAAIGSSSLGFSSDSAVAGRYSIEARSDAQTQSQAIDTSTPVPPLNFSFP